MSVFSRLLYKARDLRSRRLFDVLRRHCGDTVIDVGGAGFVQTPAVRQMNFSKWTIVEPLLSLLPRVDDARVAVVVADGQSLAIRSDAYDTVLSIQVLEHVFEPIRMIEELHRVIKPGGTMIIMVPQTANIHLVPHHYQNFTRYWLDAAAARVGAEVIEQYPLGGAWSTIASRLLLQYPAVFGVRGFRDPAIRRTPRFWIMLPFGLLVSVIAIPIAMVLSLGDLAEEPNNHLVVLRKALPLEIVEQQTAASA